MQAGKPCALDWSQNERQLAPTTVYTNSGQMNVLICLNTDLIAT